MKRNRWFVRAAAAAALCVGAPLMLSAPAADAAPLGSTSKATLGSATAAIPLAGRSVSVTASSSAADIKGLQYLLNASGAKLDVDGVYGTKTGDAVVKFQKDKKLDPDGKVGPKTMEKLGPLLKVNSTNANAVKAAQQLLVKNGHSIDVDGKFGPATEKAVKSLQSKAGVTSDGVVGPVTWTYLFGAKVGGGGGGGDCSKVTSGAPKGDTVVVGNNMRVHKCFGPTIDKMVKDAAADGITLGANSSWRDPAEQIALRKQNCGTSHYAIYEMPASQCTPPTAIPGTSRHERGLAIDFSNSASHGTAVFKWLSANGSKYHLTNLPSEPWHWSWDGH